MRAALFACLSACALAFPSVARADLFSPGELAKGHEKLEGLTNCTQCHVSGEKLSQDRCLACHTEIKGKVEKGQGFHGRIPEAQRNCNSCHHDHQGRDFALIDWGEGKESFRHEKSGFALQGKHASVECEKCHEPRRITDPAIRDLLGKQPGRLSYLGLPQKCASCHFDEHRGQTSLECQKCHGEKAFKPAPRFDHAKTAYALLGKHRTVSCDKCHPKQEDELTPRDAFPAPVYASFLKLKGIAHGSCQTCHTDPHKGRFGESCQKCHSEAGWLVLKGPAGERGFHEKTRFPLQGGHATVACAACHGPFPGEKARFRGLPFQACGACHADAHLGQLARKGAKQATPACDRCHTVQGFLPVRFELEDHEKTAYPLQGAHRAVACNLCHAQEPRLTERIPEALRKDLKRKNRPERFSLALFDAPGPVSRCESCHRDPHAGQFSHHAPKKSCSTCHQVSSFADLSFDHARDSRFALKGKHASAACGSCHRATKTEEHELVRYRPIDVSCASCHADVHAGQLASRRSEATDCERCHGTEGFKKTLFVHAPPFTTFLLDGKHTGLACEKCHPSVKVAGGVEVRRYKPLPRACEGCHADFHKGSFQGFQP